MRSKSRKRRSPNQTRKFFIQQQQQQRINVKSITLTYTGAKGLGGTSRKVWKAQVS